MGKQSITFNNRPIISGAATVVGVKEGQGPMNEWFDIILKEDMFAEKTWEKAEIKMLKEAIMTATKKSGRNESDIDVIMCGDLLSQLMSSSFMARDMSVPFIGLYGACSTMAESLLMGSIFVDGGFGDNVIVGASSHYCTAERQFRLPLEHGNQRPLQAQWTATAAGSMMVSKSELLQNNNNISICTDESKIRTVKKIRVTGGTLGKVIDTGMKDVNQMGAAMAPAAVDTILNHFVDFNREYNYYDRIFTGDLGFVGKEIAKDLLVDAGVSGVILENCYEDCGCMLYDKSQDVHGGASGCGCSASVFSGYVYKKMQMGEIKRALILSTGAMLSTISPMQGESIPGIAHAVVLEAED